MKKIIFISGVCLAALALLFISTEPTKVPSLVLVIPFLLIFIILLALFALLFQKRGMSVRRSWRIAALCAGIPLVLLVLQSIGQLTARDLLTMAALFSLSYFYVSRTTAPS
jgi:hypothetical protein